MMSVDAHGTHIQDTHHKLPKNKHDKKEKKKRKRDVIEEEAPQETTPIKKSKKSKPPNSTDHAFTPLPEPNSLANTVLQHQTASLYLPVSPISQQHALQGICAEHLSPLILTYYPPLHGVVLSYGNLRLAETPESSAEVLGETSPSVLARSIDEYAVSFVWVTADFLIFRPKRGGWIEGWVNLQNESHIGLVCWNLFNASIERNRLPRGWEWIGISRSTGSKAKLKSSGEEEQGNVNGVYEEAEPSTKTVEHEGHFVDESGNPIDGLVRFQVKDFDTSSTTDREKGFISIEGTLLPEKEEQHLLDKEAIVNGSQRRKPRIFRNAIEGSRPAASSSNTALGTPKVKHRVNY